MNKLKNEVEEYAEDFDGVFRFTNATDEDFVTPWNNKEYIYPAGKTVPMIIADESLERIQSIRKMFAKRLAEREYFKSKGFSTIKNGTTTSNGGGTMVASSYNEDVLQPWVDDCLKPLEIAKQKVKEMPSETRNIKASKPIGSGNKESDFPTVDLNEEFKESNAELLAKK